MYNILLYSAVLVLAFVCVLVVLFVLMQRPNANAGMGSALGGATTESVFGGETANVLSKATVIFITLFFLLCTGLYFAFVAKKTDQASLPVVPEVKQESSLITGGASAGTPSETPSQQGK